MPSALPNLALPQPGDVLAGKYRLARLIGEGGMGVVYEAVHTKIQQRVAIKLLLPEVIELPGVVSRFEREARAVGKLKSENTARVLDVDTTSTGIPYIVMEFLDGQDLGKTLETTGRLPIDQAVDYVLQACNAMTEAHGEGVIHRDLKPSNLFVTKKGQVKVLDFGISKIERDDEARVTATQAVVGTPLYMSPEQVRSAKHVDARTDVWSLGIILYELIAGRTPFEGSTTAAAAAICMDPPPRLANFRPDVPPELDRAIRTALEKEPERRFGSAMAFAAAIAPFGSGTVRAPDTAPAPFPPPSSSSIQTRAAEAPTIPSMASIEVARTLPGDAPELPPRRRPVAAIAIGVGALALFVAGGVITQRLHAPAEPGPTVTSEPTVTPPTAAQPTELVTTAPAPPLPAPSASVSSRPIVPSPPVSHAPARHPPPPAPTIHTQAGPAPAPTRL